LPLLAKAKSAYLVWISFYKTLPKIHRNSLGPKIDTIFIEVIEAISVASFLSPEEKLPWVRLGRRKTDTLKILLMVLWEAQSIDDSKYIAISAEVDTMGKMLGGWSGQLSKQNSPAIKAREK
jgi:hypothetical protein